MNKRKFVCMFFAIAMVLLLAFGSVSMVSAGKPTRTPTPPAPTTTPGPGFPSRVVAPYVEAWSVTNLANIATATGQKYFSMAFILGKSGCTPTWNGSQTMDQGYYMTEINNLRTVGGDVAFSFGGASGSELAQVCSSAASLQAAYQKVINTYALKWLDFDIEGNAVSASASVDLRNKALAALEAANPGLKVSYTLGVMPNGLPPAQLNVLLNAKANSVRVDVVNIMAMDYGSAYSGDMGQYAIQAAQATEAQLVNNGILASVGICPMIGQNDSNGEVFSLADASELVTWAQPTGYVTELSFWAADRDNGTCPGKARASNNCSGLTQNPFEFTNIFKTLH